jgi:hypothetical protein
LGNLVISPDLTRPKKPGSQRLTRRLLINCALRARGNGKRKEGQKQRFIDPDEWAQAKADYRHARAVSRKRIVEGHK